MEGSKLCTYRGQMHILVEVVVPVRPGQDIPVGLATVQGQIFSHEKTVTTGRQRVIASAFRERDLGWMGTLSAEQI